MYCIYCGKQIADNAAFCPYCGKPTPQSDALAELVAAARTGDKDAISALYEKAYSKVYYTVKSMIKDESTVFDIVQDTYIKAFDHLSGFQGNTKFLPWVRQIAANTARDWLKKKRPMLFAELSTGDGQETFVEEFFPDERSDNLPEQVIDQKETKRLICEIIEELPEDQRAAIGMFYYEEMSVKEIAAAMGVSESTVKSRLMYGRGKIEKKVRELEKQGTKLYSLAPLPFLLLLFHNQKTYAAEVPDSRILHTILASQPTGIAPAAAQGAGSAGAAGGIGALKIVFITLAAVAVAGLGVFGATKIASSSAGTQGASAIEGVVDEENPEESKESEEAALIEEALEQYCIIVSQADIFEYNESEYDLDSPWLELAGYRYALVQMQSDDPVPTLVLEKVMKDTQTTVPTCYARIFQYDPEAKIVRQPANERILDGGIHGGLSMAGDGCGIFFLTWDGAGCNGYVERIILEGDSLSKTTYWSGQIFEMPESITFIEIEWYESGDLSALDSWTAPDTSEEALSESADSGTLPTDGDRIVLTGTVGTYDYDEIIELQRQPDPNGDYEDSVGYSRSRTYRVILLDTPQILRLHGSDFDDYYFSGEVLMLNLEYTDCMDQYMGQHITFSIDPAHTYWPSDTSLPVDQPFTEDIHVLE